MSAAGMIPALDPSSSIAASGIAREVSLSDEARALLRDGVNVRGFLDALLAGGLPVDALLVMARALPKRYVIAWACDCLKGLFAQDGTANDVDRAGLSLAQQWLADPTEENRRAAMEFAERAELGCPGAWIAASAGWSGGSLLPKGYDPVPPPDHLPAEAAVAALRLAASRSAEYATLIKGFVVRALQIFGPAAPAGAAQG